MYALLVDAESADGRVDRATDAALRLLELGPLDIDARWALVKCYALRSLLDQAWQALTADGQAQPLNPRSSEETALWVMLGARFTTDPQFTGRALALTQRWQDNSDLVGRVLANLHWRAIQPASSLFQRSIAETTERSFAQVNDHSPLIVAGHRARWSLPRHLTASPHPS